MVLSGPLKSPCGLEMWGKVAYLISPSSWSPWQCQCRDWFWYYLNQKKRLGRPLVQIKLAHSMLSNGLSIVARTSSLKWIWSISDTRCMFNMNHFPETTSPVTMLVILPVSRLTQYHVFFFGGFSILVAHPWVLVNLSIVSASNGPVKVTLFYTKKQRKLKFTPVHSFMYLLLYIISLLSSSVAGLPARTLIPIKLITTTFLCQLWIFCFQ